jgi:hypothetical protein
MYQAKNNRYEIYAGKEFDLLSALQTEYGLSDKQIQKSTEIVLSKLYEQAAERLGKPVKELTPADTAEVIKLLGDSAALDKVKTEVGDSLAEKLGIPVSAVNKIFDSLTQSFSNFFNSALYKALEKAGGPEALFNSVSADKTRNAIIKEVFGKDLVSLNPEEADILSRFVVETRYKLSDKASIGLNRFSEQTRNQAEMVAQNLMGKIVALTVAGGKTMGFDMVYGNRSLTLGQGKLKGELIVAAKGEVDKFVNQTGEYQQIANALGYKFVDGSKLYETRSLGELIGHLNGNSNVVVVWDVNTRGHVTREMQSVEGIKLKEAIGKINTRGIDEADVGALLQKAFIVGIQEKADINFVNHVEALVSDIHKLLGTDVKPIEVLNETDFNQAIAFTKDKTGQIKISDGLGTALKSINEQYKGEQIKDVLRALTDKEGADYVYETVGENRYSAHKSSLKEGVEIGTKDNSWTYNVTLGLIKLSKEVSSGKEYAESELDTIKKSFDVSRTGSEATLSQVFVRNKNVDTLTFGGSGTMDVARELARSMYGREVVDIKEAKFTDPDLAVKEAKFLEGDAASLKGKAEYAADWALSHSQEAGALVRVSSPEMMREIMKDILRKSNPGEDSLIDKLFSETEKMPELSNGKDGLLDLIRDSGLKGADKLKVIDIYTEGVESIARSTGKGDIVLAIDKAGRGYDFGANLRANGKAADIDLLIMDAHQLNRGQLLQWLGRTGRGGTESSRELVYDNTEIQTAKEYLSRLNKFLGKENVNTDLSVSLKDIENTLNTDVTKDNMLSFVEAFSTFAALSEKSNAILFKVNSELPAKLMKEALAQLIQKESIAGRTEAVEFLRAKEKDLLQCKIESVDIYYS